MRYLGLDLGTRTLGTSLSDTTLTIASSYKTISFEDSNYWQQDNENEDLDNELDHTDTNYLEEIARSRKYDMDYQDDFDDKPKKKGRGKHF